MCGPGHRDRLMSLGHVIRHRLRLRRMRAGGRRLPSQGQTAEQQQAAADERVHVTQSRRRPQKMQVRPAATRA